MRPPAIFKAARAMLVAGAFVCAAASASAQAGDGVPSPFTLLRRSPTEPSWAATLRLRNAESRFRDDPQWRSAYCQLRAQSEIWLGDHAAALREIGKCWGGWSDTTYSIPAGTRLRTA